MIALHRQGHQRTKEQRRCRDLLAKLKAEQETALRSQRYPAASCPICFEELQQRGSSGSDGQTGPSKGKLV